MYCINCGKQILDDAAFCPYCGEKTAFAVQGKNVPVNSDRTDDFTTQTAGPVPPVKQPNVGQHSNGPYNNYENNNRYPDYNSYKFGYEPGPQKKKRGFGIIIVLEILAIIVVLGAIFTMIFSERKDNGGDSDAGPDVLTESDISAESAEVDLSAESTESASPDEEDGEEEKKATPTPTPTPLPTPTPTIKVVRETSCYVTDAQPSDLGSYRRPSFSSGTASSHLYQKDHPEYDNSAKSIIDGDYITSWQDGGSGNGTGESITLNFDSDQEVKYLEFRLGNWRTDRYYSINPRPRKMTMTINGKHYSLEFTDAKICHYVVFDEAVSFNAVDFYIDGVYSGSETHDCCIAEITAYAD